MRFCLIAAFFVLMFSCNNSDTEPKPVGKFPSRHSPEFNRSFDSLMTAYYHLAEAFVNWDSAAVDPIAAKIAQRLDSLPLSELDSGKNDEARRNLDSTRSSMKAMIATSSITGKRHELNSFSQHLFHLLNAVQYDDDKVYLQSCGMAFENEDAYWLSAKEDRRNPYLGLHDPTYGKAMLDCGDLEDSIVYSSRPPEKK